MKVTTIDYSESRESVNAIGLKTWKKLRMEAEVEENDILQTSVAFLKEYVKGMILDEEEIEAIVGHIDEPRPTKESAIESHIKTINECTTLNNLKIFEKLVNNTNDENLTHAYMKKHEELLLKSK